MIDAVVQMSEKRKLVLRYDLSHLTGEEIGWLESALYDVGEGEGSESERIERYVGGPDNFASWEIEE